jgi:hypothetical protein
LSEPASAKCSRHEAGKKHRGRARYRRKKANRKKRIAKNHSVQCEDKYRKRRLVDVPCAKMFAACGVIQFIAKYSVAGKRIRIKMEQKLRQGEKEKKQRAAREEVPSADVCL